MSDPNNYGDDNYRDDNYGDDNELYAELQSQGLLCTDYTEQQNSDFDGGILENQEKTQDSIDSDEEKTV